MTAYHNKGAKNDDESQDRRVEISGSDVHDPNNCKQKDVQDHHKGRVGCKSMGLNHIRTHFLDDLGLATTANLPLGHAGIRCRVYCHVSLMGCLGECEIWVFLEVTLVTCISFYDAKGIVLESRK